MLDTASSDRASITAGRSQIWRGELSGEMQLLLWRDEATSTTPRHLQGCYPDLDALTRTLATLEASP